MCANKVSKAIGLAEPTEPKKAGAVQLWYGANQSLLGVEVARWVELFKQKHPMAQVIKLTLDKGNEGEVAVALHQAAQGGGLFAKQQLIILTGFLAAEAKGELSKLVLETITNPPAGMVLLLREGARVALSKGLGAKCKTLAETGGLIIKEYAELSEPELERWITEHARAVEAVLAPGVARQLGKLIGNNFVRLDNELAKLSAYAAGEPVHMHDLDSLVSADTDEEAFVFLDAVGRRDFAAAQAALRQQFEQGASPQSLVGLLAWHLRVLTSVREALGEGKRHAQPRELATELGFHPFVVSKALQQLPYYSLERLTWLYEQLSELDVALKTRATEPQVLFSLFLSKLASLSLQR